MSKKVALAVKISLIFTIILIIFLIIIALIFGNPIRYSIAENCYNQQKWDCAISNYQILDNNNYKDAHAKLIESKDEKMNEDLRVFDSYNSFIGSFVLKCLKPSGSKTDIDSVNKTINTCQNSKEAISQTAIPKNYNTNLKQKIQTLKLIYADECYNEAFFAKFAYNSMITPSKEALKQIDKHYTESDKNAQLITKIIKVINDDINYSTNTPLDFKITSENQPYIEPIEKQDLEVIRANNCSDEYGIGRYACGVLKNNTSLAYYGVTLTFDLIDNQGNIISETSTHLKKMAPHATWKFKAIIWDENATSWQLANIDYENSGY